MTGEDKIHVVLLTVLAAASAAVFSVPPSAEPISAPVAARAPVAPPGDVRREELDAAILLLRDRIQSRYAGSNDPGELAFAVCALGPAALGADPEAALGRLTRGWPASLSARAASLAHITGAAGDHLAPAPALGGVERTPLAVLGTLLEAGVPLDRRVPLDAGHATLGELVKAALEAGPDPSEGAQAQRLDLAAFATLAGMRDQAAQLGQLAYESLRRLEVSYREWHAPRGDGELDGPTLARLGKAFREGGELQPSAAELHASAATFRAVAVLGERDLDERARRHLGALSYRHRVERALYAQLLAEADSAAARERVHVTAVERLGRLEQALYQAHLLYRTEQRRDPTPELARSMRQVARDLLDHLREARGSILADASPAGAAHRDAVLRAAVHALRGLRTARVAI